MKKVLLVEDNDDIRNNTAEILELSNYEVITAENGKVGVEKAIEHKPDIIVCDIMMPVLDGYGLFHAVHKNEELKNTPFIFLTAKSERGDFRKGMELGADDYITKPFDATELLNAIDSRLKKHALLKKELQPGIDGLNSLVEISFGQDVLHVLLQDRNTNTYKKKEKIYSEGNHANTLYYINKGKVKIYKSNDDGKELIVDLLSAGDFIGYVTLLEGGTYKESAEALETCDVAMIPKAEVEDLLNRNITVAKKFIQLLAKNITGKEQKLLGLAYNSLRKKVADALMLLSAKYKKQDEEAFTIDISRENLATIAGTATESLIRTLSDFKSEKLIEIQNGNIKILNEAKLKNLIN